MSSPILVIGALGNVGMEVVKQLQAKGQKIRAADIDERKLKARFGDFVEAVHFDFFKPETYEAAFHNMEKLFLLRPPHITDVERYLFPRHRRSKTGRRKTRCFSFSNGYREDDLCPSLQSGTVSTKDRPTNDIPAL